VQFIGEKNTCVDYYSNGQWQTSQPDIVLTVNKAHTVLIRLRRSLLEPLTDCPGLDDEIKLQPRTSSRNKRSADNLVSPIKKVPRIDQDSAPLQSKGKGKERMTDIVDIDSSSPSPPPRVSQNSKGKGKAKVTDIIVIDPASPSPPPPPRVPTEIQPNSKTTKPFPLEHLLPESSRSHTSRLSGSRKAFPRDYYVVEIIEGLHTMNTKIDSERISQEAAFHVIFPGAKYHKGQLSSTRTILARAGDRLQRRFRKYGATSEGMWRKLKALLPKMILNKGFADDQAIRDLELSADDYLSDTIPKQIISNQANMRTISLPHHTVFS